MQHLLSVAVVCVVLQAWRLKPSLRKLQRSRSLIMGTYYGFLWAITILNLFRCILQMSRTGTSSTHASLWNAFWLLTRFGRHHNQPWWGASWGLGCTVKCTSCTWREGSCPGSDRRGKAGWLLRHTSKYQNAAGIALVGSCYVDRSGAQHTTHQAQPVNGRI